MHSVPKSTPLSGATGAARMPDMHEPLFADKSHRPTDTELVAVLGRTKRHWDSLVAHVREVNPTVEAEWKFYTAKFGWTFVARAKRRNLLYLTPDQKRFRVSLAFGDKAVAAAEQSDLPERVIKPIRESPKYPEGRAVRIEVTSARDLAIARQLLALKIAN
jgi:hypothetical protein